LSFISFEANSRLFWTNLFLRMPITFVNWIWIMFIAEANWISRVFINLTSMIEMRVHKPTSVLSQLIDNLHQTWVVIVHNRQLLRFSGAFYSWTIQFLRL
jgi:cell shape-determining protein MreC